MFQDTVVTKAVTVSSLSSRSLSRLNTQGSVQLHLVSQHGRSSQVPCFTFAVPLLGTLSLSSSAIKVMLTQYNYFSLCETFPRLSQIPNLQNYELLPSGSRIFYMYHMMMILITVLVYFHIFLQTELLGG